MMEHAINLTHDGTLILRIPKGYKVDKVVVEEMGTDNRKEYVPATNVGDMISRQMAIDELDSCQTYLFDTRDDDPKISKEDAQYALEQLPSVQPTRPTPSNTLGALDCVERKKVIDAAKDWYDGLICGSFRGLEKRLKALPSAEPEPQWIPCSERLPEEYVDVLVWFEYYRYGEYNRMYSTYGIGDYDAEYDKWWINHESGWRDLHVFAWMPLPERYRGDKK